MSSPIQTPPTRKGSGTKRSHRELIRTGALVVLAVLLTLFAVLNTNTVRVHWIVGSGEAPLIIVIVATLLVGVIITHLAQRRSGKRH